MSVRLVLADDHAMVREGLKSLLQAKGAAEVVGEADTGTKTVALARRLRPHIVVMDVAMPGLNGIEATRRILRDNPHVKVLGISGHANKAFVREMLTAGASGYVLKKRAAEDLVRAIGELMRGKTYLSPDIARGVIDDYIEVTHAKGGDLAFVVLTPREREVVQQIVEGKSTKEIAGILDVSVKTIETHRRNIMEKLDLHSVAELTKYAVREGVTPLDP